MHAQQLSSRFRQTAQHNLERCPWINSELACRSLEIAARLYANRLRTNRNNSEKKKRRICANRSQLLRKLFIISSFRHSQQTKRSCASVRVWKEELQANQNRRTSDLARLGSVLLRANAVHDDEDPVHMGSATPCLSLCAGHQRPMRTPPACVPERIRPQSWPCGRQTLEEPQTSNPSKPKHKKQLTTIKWF